MINFFYTTNFKINNKKQVSDWIKHCISNFNFDLGELNYIFCDDDYLHNLNLKFLNHDTLTDILSFDNTIGKEINGDIYISVDRVKENSIVYNCSFKEELHRVIIHGVLHFFGFNDTTKAEKEEMRIKENECLSLLNT